MEIKIYIANLGKYNEGELVGKWVTLPIDEEELNEVFAEIGLGYFDENGNYVHGLEVDGIFYEEWAIHDYEAPFEIHEYDNIWRLNEIAEKMSEMTEEQIKAVSALVDWGYCSDFEDAIDEFNNGNAVIWHEESMADIAQEYYSEFVDKDNFLMNFIDWEAVGDYLDTSGTFIKIEHGLWVEYRN